MDTYEKKYKEAVEKIRNLLDEGDKKGYTIVTYKKDFESIFPELVESEDEKTRKEIISALKYANHEGVYDKHLAWLERQGKHANFRDKIQVGDKVTRNEDGVLVNLSQLNRVAKKNEKQDKHTIYKVPAREVILAIWDLGNEWKELTNGCISTEYGTQLDYIQKHWCESEYYLREKQGEQRSTDTNNKFIRMRETKPKDISEFLDRLTTVEQEFLWEHIAKIRELDKD